MSQVCHGSGKFSLKIRSLVIFFFVNPARANLSCETLGKPVLTSSLIYIHFLWLRLIIKPMILGKA